MTDSIIVLTIAVMTLIALISIDHTPQGDVNTTYETHPDMYHNTSINPSNGYITPRH